MLNAPNFLRRIGRHLVWGRPELYRPFGIARRRGDCRETNYDIWVDGFPRSANTFAVKSLRTANPSLRIRSHLHIPAFIVQSLRDGKPGMLMMRRPEEAVVSWAIFWQERLAGCLDYYIDFHRALKSVAAECFIASFRDVTTHFDEVVWQFNQKFGTELACPAHNPQTVAECFAEMDREHQRQGAIDEMRVPRPSQKRSSIKLEISRRLRETPSLRRKLALASELYAAIHAGHPSASRPVTAFGTQDLPTAS